MALHHNAAPSMRRRRLPAQHVDSVLTHGNSITSPMTIVITAVRRIHHRGRELKSPGVSSIVSTMTSSAAQLIAVRVMMAARMTAEAATPHCSPNGLVTFCV